MNRIHIYITSIITFLIALNTHTVLGQFSKDPGQIKNNATTNLAIQDTSNKDLIKLINSEEGTFLLEKDETINVLVGNVMFEHKGDILIADSARLNINKNNVYAYGNVRVTQTDGTTAYADQMFYNGNNNIVELIKNVELVSGKDHLWSNYLEYNLKTQIGKYNNKGTLLSGNTVIESKNAVYNGNTNDARFTGDVNVLDPEYEIVSADLNYNTQSRIATFYGPSIINNDSSTLYTTSGTYNSVTEVANFYKRSSVLSVKQYLEADSLHYDRKTGLGTGKGNVIVIDSTQNATLYCQFATVNELTKQVMSTKNPYMKMVKDNDSIFILADTFFAEPIKNLKLDFSNLSAQDSLLRTFDLLNRVSQSIPDSQDNILSNKIDSLQNISKKGDNIINQMNNATDTSISNNYRNEQQAVDTTPKNITINNIEIDTVSYKTTGQDLINDSLLNNSIDSSIVSGTNITYKETYLPKEFIYDPSDTTDPRYIIAYHNVIIYNDSFQAQADSIFYSQHDSIMQMHESPILWAQNGQITGEVIYALVDSNNIKWVRIPKQGIVIQQSTTANEEMFDQIQGNTITAFLNKKNEIDSVIANGSAQTIYYLKDDNDAYVGVSEAKSNDLKIDFYTDTVKKTRAIEKVTYYSDNTQTTTPIRDSQPEMLRLPRFIWKKKSKINSLEDFFSIIKKREDQPLLKDVIEEKLQPKQKP